MSVKAFISSSKIATRVGIPVWIYNSYAVHEILPSHNLALCHLYSFISHECKLPINKWELFVFVWNHPGVQSRLITFMNHWPGGQQKEQSWNGKNGHPQSKATAHFLDTDICWSYFSHTHHVVSLAVAFDPGKLGSSWKASGQSGQVGHKEQF